MTRQTETAEHALQRIQSGMSRNDTLTILLFSERGVDPEDIDPRANVLTYRAWQAKGRQVARGAISARLPVLVSTEDDNGAKRKFCKPTAVFHVSQTIPADAPKGSRPDAWHNKRLIREGTYAEPEETEAR